MCSSPHQPLPRYPSPPPPKVIQQLHSVLDARPPIRNLAEVVFAKLLLISKTERTMIGRNHLQIIRGKPLPKPWLVLLLSQRRSKNILRLFKTLPRHLVLNRKQKILRASLGVCGKPAIARLTHLI